MIDEATILKIKNLPPKYQQEVKNFVEFLETKKNVNTGIKKRKTGVGKGSFTFMADDFDAPLKFCEEENNNPVY